MIYIRSVKGRVSLVFMEGVGVGLNVGYYIGVDCEMRRRVEWRGCCYSLYGSRWRLVWRCSDRVDEDF